MFSVALAGVIVFIAIRYCRELLRQLPRSNEDFQLPCSL
jgi:hypothetical protein